MRWPTGIEVFWLLVAVGTLKLLGPSVAWPAAIIGVALLFREQVGEILSTLSRLTDLKYKDLELKLAAAKDRVVVQEMEEQVKSRPESLPPRLNDDSGSVEGQVPH